MIGGKFMCEEFAESVKDLILDIKKATRSSKIKNIIFEFEDRNTEILYLR